MGIHRGGSMCANTRSGLRHGRSCGVSIAALLTLVPTVAMAQPALGTPDPARADAMHQEAEALIQTQGKRSWKEAARLFERAATLRAPDDAAAIDEQSLAGQLMYYVGSLSRAQTNLAGAAERALRVGRVLESAQLFLRAAFVARERGDPDAARFARSARQLASSPHLSEPQREEILSRIIADAVSGRRGGY